MKSLSTPVFNYFLILSAILLLPATTKATRMPGVSYPGDSAQYIPRPVMGKLVIMVDMSNQSVAGGVYIAANFFSSIGLNDWTPYAMCELGNNIWAICITNVPAGRWQYKFLNGPGGWEFQSSGGPCTNPADNNNRWLNVSGGTQTEGPFCFQSCNLFCNGPVPILSDVEPPMITEPVPANITIECGSTLPDATALTASDNCDVNATLTTGMPVQTQTTGTCGGRVVTRTWSVTDCWNNRTTARQTITVRDQTPPVISVSVPANITVQCGSAPPPATLPASDACDATVTATAMPTDVASGGGGPCGTRTVRRTWQARDCTGNTATVQQIITILDRVPPVITAIVPASITVSCGNIPAPAPLTAGDACDPNVTATAAPADNASGLNACGTGVLVRTWRVSDCAGNSTSRTQTIFVQDTTPPSLTPPAPITASCSNLPTATAASARANDNCSGTPVITYEGETAVGSGCPYQLRRVWRAVDCSGNAVTAAQIIEVIDTVGPVFQKIPKDTTVCTGFVPPMDTLRWMDCGLSGRKAGKDTLMGSVITRTWQHTDACGNTGTAVQKIRIIPPPPINAGTDKIITCGMTSVTIGDPAAPATGYTYLWAGPGVVPGQNAQPSLTVSAAGEYTLVMTDTTGGRSCQARDTVQVSRNISSPAALIAAAQPLNCLRTSITLDGSASTGTGMLTYQWIGPGNTVMGTAATQMVSQEGTYTLIVTDGLNGCTATSGIVVNRNATPPTANAGNDQNLTCTVTTVNIGTPALPVFSYTWSRDGNVAGTTAVLTTGTPGTYILRVTDPANGCFAADTVTVGSLGGLPAADAGAAKTITCRNANVDLDGSGSSSGAGIAYQWFGPGNVLLGTNLTQNVAQGGLYTLRVTNNATGCSAVATVQVTANVVVPVANAGTDKTLNCQTSTVSIGSAALPNVTYNWSGGAGTAAVISVSAPGAYMLTVTDNSNGCSATDEVIVGEDRVPPVAHAGSGRTLDCATPAVNLDGSASVTGPDIRYQWISPAGNNLGTAITQRVTQPGTYTLVVTSAANGCSSTAVVTVTTNSVPPVADAGADRLLNCRTNSVQIGTAALTGLNYQWSGSAGNAALTTVNTPATYILTVTDPATGCTAVDSVAVIADSVPPVANAGPGGIIDCKNTSVLLDGTASSSAGTVTYEWSGPGGATLGTNPTQPVNQPGTYTLAVTNTTNGCSASDTVTVRLNVPLPPANAGADQTLTCLVATATLGTVATPGLQYNWSNNAGTTATVVVTASGTYSLTVTDPQTGCTATDEVQVNTNATLADVNAGADQVLTCNRSSVELGTAPVAGFQYVWSKDGAAAGNTSLLTVGQPGLYVLTAINPINGCTGKDTVMVTRNNTAPLAEVNPVSALTCLVRNVVLDGSPSEQGTDIAYQWTGPNSALLGTAITQNVAGAGVYRLVVTNTATGCSSSATVSVLADTLSPVADAGTDKTLTCAKVSAEVGTAAVVGWTYNWSGNAGAGARATVKVPGDYTLTVTDTKNGCTDTDVVTVRADTLPPKASAGPDQIRSCTKTVVQLDGTGSATGPRITYQWFDAKGIALNATALQNVSLAGIYRLVVTDTVTGCSAAASVQVTADTIAPPVDAGPDQTLTCASPSATIGTPAAAGLTYEWTLDGVAAGGVAILTVTVPGTYQIFTTASSNGCRSVDTVVIDRSGDFPFASAGPAQVLTCSRDTVLLDGSASDKDSSIVYQWLGIGNNFLGTNVTQKVAQQGAYILVVTNTSNGCSSTATVQVTSDRTPPTVSAGDDKTLTCTTTAINVGTPGMAGIEYSWSNGSTTLGTTATLTVNGAGLYILSARNPVNGCTATDAVQVIADTTAPVVSISGAGALNCRVKEVTLDAAGSATGNSIRYQWLSPGNVALGTGQTQKASQPGLYTLIVTNSATGCTGSDTLRLHLDNTPPVAEAGPDRDLTCAVLSVLIGTPPPVPGGYSYQWSNGSTAAVTPVSTSGTYTLTVTGTVNGCTATDAVIVHQNGDLPLAKAIALGKLTCDTAVIMLSGAGSAVGQGISYRWFSPANVITGTAISQQVQVPGIYRLEVSNSNTGCTAVASVEVKADTVRPVLSLSSAFELPCNGDPVSIVPGVSAPSGSSLIYQWSGPGNFSSPAAQISVRTPGNYYLTVTQTTNGCTASASTSAQALSGIQSARISMQQTGCALPAFGQMRIDSVEGGSGPYLYSLNQSSFTTQVLYERLTPKDYTLRVQDSKGCEWDTTFAILPAEVFSIRLPETLTIELGERIEIVPVYSTNPSRVRWGNAATLSCDTCLQPWAQPFVNTAYTVTAVNRTGCTASATVQIVVQNSQKIYVPNIFSPNSSSANNRVTIFAGNNVELIRRFQIFNRWGELVFAKENFLHNQVEEGWDGQFNGREAAVGVYAYFIEVLFRNGETTLLTGDVLLVR